MRNVLKFFNFGYPEKQQFVDFHQLINQLSHLLPLLVSSLALEY